MAATNPTTQPQLSTPKALSPKDKQKSKKKLVVEGENGFETPKGKHGEGGGEKEKEKNGSRRQLSDEKEKDKSKEKENGKEKSKDKSKEKDKEIDKEKEVKKSKRKSLVSPTGTKDSTKDLMKNSPQNSPINSRANTPSTSPSPINSLSTSSPDTTNEKEVLQLPANRALNSEKRSASTNNLQKKPLEREIQPRPQSYPATRFMELDECQNLAREVGKLMLKINHNSKHGCLEVTIQYVEFGSLSNSPNLYPWSGSLSTTQINGDSNFEPSTYVKASLIPEAQKSTSTFRSKIQKNTQSPKFNETFSFYLSLEEIKKRMLHVSMWSYNKEHGNSCIGELTVNLSSIYDEAEMSDFLPLMKLPNKNVEDGYSSDDEMPPLRRKSTGPQNEINRKSRSIVLSKLPQDQIPAGEIKMTLDHDPEGKTLKIIVLTIRDFQADKQSNIFIKTMFSPDSKKWSKKKTKSVKNSVTPIINETIVYNLDEFFKKTQTSPETLEISVCGKDSLIGSHVSVNKYIIGTVSVPLKDVFLSSYLSGWFPLFQKKKQILD